MGWKLHGWGQCSLRSATGGLRISLSRMALRVEAGWRSMAVSPRRCLRFPRCWLLETPSKRRASSASSAEISGRSVSKATWMADGGGTGGGGRIRRFPIDDRIQRLVPPRRTGERRRDRRRRRSLGLTSWWFGWGFSCLRLPGHADTFLTHLTAPDNFAQWIGFVRFFLFLFFWREEFCFEPTEEGKEQKNEDREDLTVNRGQMRVQNHDF